MKGHGEEIKGLGFVHKWGRQVLLGKDLDEKVRLYLHKVRGGGVMCMWIAMAAARGCFVAMGQ